MFERVLTGKRVLPLTPFVKHLFKAGKRFHLITTNYDRLVEWRRKRRRSAWTHAFSAIFTGDPIRNALPTLIANPTTPGRAPPFAICRACAFTNRTGVSTGLRLGARSSGVRRLKPASGHHHAGCE